MLIIALLKTFQMKTKTRIFITAIFIIVMSLVLYLFLTKTFAGYRFRYQIRLETSNLKLVDVYKEISGTNKIEWVTGESGDIHILIGHSMPENPQKFIGDKIFLLNSLFEPTKSPYPEVITNIIDCPTEFKPIKQDFSTGIIYKLYAGGRYGYGICAKDLVKYDSFYGLFDCGKKGVFEIKIFGPAGGSRIEKIIKSFSCND